ncbi:hypothetical protein [Deinococcus aquaticus]|uniref:hypothetical protein n=1 Tax=Deinococcus aquaticus TaxID=328692 RepID=UPI00361B9703
MPRPEEPVSAPPPRGRVRHLPALVPLLGPARRLSRRGGALYRWAQRQWRQLRPAPGGADAPRLKSRLFLLALMLTGAYHGTLVMTRAYARGTAWAACCSRPARTPGTCSTPGTTAGTAACP